MSLGDRLRVLARRLRRLLPQRRSTTVKRSSPTDRSGRVRISVAIPSYNHGRFIEEAITSVLSQDFDGLELIVVDDGSSDDSVERIAGFDDPRLKWFSQENQGAHAAINRALDAATGEILTILNSDDAYEAGRVRRLVEIFDADPEVVLAGSWLAVVDENGDEIGLKRGFETLPPWPPCPPGESLRATGRLELALLESNFLATTSNMAFRRRLWDADLKFLPLRYAHDWDFALQALRFGRLSLLESPLLRYRVHSSNTIREGASEGEATMRWEILWLLARHVEALLERYGPETVLGRTALEERSFLALPDFGASVLARRLRSLAAADPPRFLGLLSTTDPERRSGIGELEEQEA